jgi:hypothetical protein
MASASKPPATVSLNIDGHNFANGINQTPKIYINKDILTTQKNDDLSNLFNDLYTEYKKKPTKFADQSGKLSTEFIKNNGSYAVCIQLQIVKNPKAESTTQIAPGEAVIIEFEPYVIKLSNTSKRGGRRRTKMSKRDPMYHTRKNKK